MQHSDYYDVLGVARDASAQAIKTAYRQLARRYHPDVSEESDAEEQFKAVSAAYDTLKDPERRRAYDEMGAEWHRNSDSSRGEPGYPGFDEASFGDFFEEIFGATGAEGFASQERFRMRGSDQRAIATVSLEDAFRGSEQMIEIGGADGPSRRLKFKLPAGTSDGQQIRLAGQGMRGYGGEPAGDLYLQVRLKPHRLFRVDGRDIHLLLPITPWEAALGAKINVPTLGGKVAMAIKPGTQSGQRLRLAGRGLPGKPAGDQLVEMQVKLPPADSDEKRAVFEQMRECMAFDPRAEI